MAFSSQNFTAPKIGKGNISSPLSSGASKISKATPKLRVNRINFGNRRIVRSPALESQSPVVNSSAIKSQSSIESTLSETNKILVDIQKQLALDFSTRIADEKEKNKTIKEEKSKRKFALKEGSLESVKKIGSIVKSGASAVLAPVESAFDKILEFITLIGAGVAVNTVFNWLSDEGNKKTLMGWFDFIKEHYKWVLGALGAVVALKLIGPISMIVKLIGGAVGLLLKGLPLLKGLLLNPLFLKAILAIGAGVLLYKGGEFLLKKARNLVTGGEDYSTAHSQLDQQLADAGMDKSGRRKNLGVKARREGKTGRDEEQEKIFQEVKKKREELYALKDQMNAEIKEKQSKLKIVPTPPGRKKSGYVNPNEKARRKVDMEVREDYKSKISNILTPTTIEARKMGGPVKAGRPYLVGEGGPELMVPNIDGTVINNMKTEKIYQTISSRRKGRGGINMVNLPPITNKLPPPELPSMGDQATDVPDIASANPADRYRQMSSSIYGIMV